MKSLNSPLSKYIHACIYICTNVCTVCVCVHSCMTRSNQTTLILPFCYQCYGAASESERWKMSNGPLRISVVTAYNQQVKSTASRYHSGSNSAFYDGQLSTNPMNYHLKHESACW